MKMNFPIGNCSHVLHAFDDLPCVWPPLQGHKDRVMDVAIDASKKWVSSASKVDPVSLIYREDIFIALALT